MRVDYDTSGISPRERFDYWTELVCKNYFTANALTEEGDRAFEGSLSDLDIGRIKLGQLEAPLHFWSRTPCQVRRDDHEEYIVSLLLKGTCELEQLGRTATQHEGEIVFYESSSPLRYDMNASAQLVKIPRKLLDSRVADPRSLIAVRFSAPSPLAPVLSSIIAEVSRLSLGDTEAPVAAPRIESAIVDIIVAMCDLIRDGEADGRAARLDKVMRYARANLGDERLTAQTLARHGGMSVRTLNRLFASLGTTPMRWLWAQRLEASRAALAGRRVRSVTEAAFLTGFNELGHFSRSYKKAFGVTPLETLRGS